MLALGTLFNEVVVQLRKSVSAIMRRDFLEGFKPAHQCRNLVFDIQALSALIVRGVEPGITRTCSGVHKGYILVIVSVRVCSGPQQTRSLSSEFTTERKFQQPASCRCVAPVVKFFVGRYLCHGRFGRKCYLLLGRRTK